MSERDQKFAVVAAAWAKAHEEHADALKRLEAAQRERGEALARLEAAALSLGDYVGRNTRRKVAMIGGAREIRRAVLVEHADRPGGVPDVSLLDVVEGEPSRGSAS